MGQRKKETDRGASDKPQGKLQWLIQKGWWLHSFGALGFGLAVMLFAKSGLKYADKILTVVGACWLLMFVALRFIVGPTNRKPKENVAKRGMRVATNYLIKQLYQQMFFFLTPLYAASATWSTSSFNWIFAPLLLFFAVLSTMDLIFDNFVMERRLLAACMYGLALFCVLNLMLPLLFKVNHFNSLMIAAGVTPIAIAMLSFSLRSVFSGGGLGLTVGATVFCLLFAWFGRGLVPPVPATMGDGAVGHGVPGQYECLPAKKPSIRSDRLDQLRCGSTVSEPGGLKSGIRHVWRKGSKVIARAKPEAVRDCNKNMVVSYLAKELKADKKSLPSEMTGKWTCSIETTGGQLIGRVSFKIVDPPDGAKTEGTKGTDKAPVKDAVKVPVKDADKNTPQDASPVPTPTPKIQ